jgi:hypothetical protein
MPLLMNVRIIYSALVIVITGVAHVLQGQEIEDAVSC